MKNARYIWLRLAALAGGVMILILIMIGASVLNSKDIMMAERQGQLRSIVETAISVATSFDQQVELGEITEEEAKEKTKAVVRSMRYGKNGYLFIYNINGITEAHAFYKELEGKYRMNLRDAKGVPYIQNQIQKALDGGGFTYYHYKKPNRGSQVYPKMVYDELYKPWGWVFVTGAYIDDIDNAFAAQMLDWLKLIVPIFLLLLLLIYYIARALAVPMDKLETSVIRANEATRAKTNFLANMSHEIRTPLNGAMGMLALMLGTKLSHQQKEWAQIAYRSCEDLLNLINDILDISKVEAEKMPFESVPFDLQANIKTITDLMYPRAQVNGVEVIVAFQSDLPRYVIGDPVRVRQVLLNLVTNAVKFTKEGYVMISVEGKRRDDKYHLKFEVKDTGIGIPADIQEYIFEKFSQAEEGSTRSVGGTGLGLAISRKLSRMMGGDVGVRSSEGEGSTFWFTAVLDFEDSPPAVSSLPPHERGEKVLVQYKHHLMKKALIGHLNSWAYQCEDADQGSGVATMLQQNVALGQPSDFVVIELPDYVEETKLFEDQINIISNTSPHTNIIMIVRPDALFDYSEIRLSSTVGVLTKPVFPQELFDIINKLVECRRDKKPARFVGLNVESASKNKVADDAVVPVKPVDKLILIAEDQKVNQMLMRTVLGQFGYKTDVASNGTEAVRLAAEKQYDLIFMDGHMPEMDGLEATKQIREFEVRLKRHTPIVALTADAMKGDRDKCLAAGMDDYLHKPVKALQIKEMVEKHTQEKPPVLTDAAKDLPSKGE